MNNSNFTVEQFRRIASKRLEFLEGRGFHRKPELEETGSTGATIIYLGRHVGFVLSLDIRDQCMDDRVVKVCNGKMKRNWEGGYSSSLFTHLVNYRGYRGSPSGSRKPKGDETGDDPLQRMIDGWARLLLEAGEILLSDTPESLPVKR